MHWLNLPEPASDRELGFHDINGAKAWLAALPVVQPRLMQGILSEQLNAVDAAHLPAPLAIDFLNLLHTAILATQARLEARFTHKALPLSDDEENAFVATQKLWTQLGIAYLRQAPHFAPEEKRPLLFRATNAFRMAEFVFFLAHRECPADLGLPFFSILIQASSSNILNLPLSDPDFPHFGESNIAGLLAWTILLRRLNPYRLSATQLTVANRAIRRWRELSSFQLDAEQSGGALAIPFAGRLAAELPDGVPRYLNIEPVIRKIHSRIASLRAGNNPESLKLGRELSTIACISLLDDMKQQLRLPTAEPVTHESEAIKLAFGSEDAYAVFRGELLNPNTSLSLRSNALSNQRMAMFGFDRIEQMPTAVRKLEIPGEPWILTDGKAVRQASAGPRHQAPCLIATRRSGRPQLGVLRALLSDRLGALTAKLDWYDGRIEACRLQRPNDGKQTQICVFLLTQGRQTSLFLPGNVPIRLGTELILDGEHVPHKIPTAVIEHGIDFVHYACQPD